MILYIELFYFIGQKPLVSDIQRVDTDSFKEMIENLPAAELEQLNRRQHEQTVEEHKIFKEHYKRGEC